MNQMTNTILKNLLYIALFFVSVFSYGQNIQIKTITVEPYLRLLNDAYFKNLSIKSPEVDADFIEGFKFKWGNRYVIKVKIEQLKDPPQDVSSIKYTLIKVISKTAVSKIYQFNMRLEKDLYLGIGEQENTFKYVNDSTYNYFDKIDIEIPITLKNEFIKIIDEGINRTGVFTFINETKIRLINLN